MVDARLPGPTSSTGFDVDDPGDAVLAAAQRIRGLVRRTPVVGLQLRGRDIWLKLEHLQVTGSFKARGATNALRAMERLPSGVVAASGGNHGLGVAHAARTLDLPATVVVPAGAPREKVLGLERLGAAVVRHGDEYADAQAHAVELAAVSGWSLLHPFADPAVIAGQGTVGLEILEDLDDRTDAIVVAVGGGGLLAGVAAACAASGVRAIGVEPRGIPTMHAALHAGQPVEVAVRSVTASALGARITDARNLALVQRYAEAVHLVSDEAILAARDLLWSACRLAVEPAAAAPLAAVLDGSVEADRPCLVLCGANSAWKPAD